MSRDEKRIEKEREGGQPGTHGKGEGEIVVTESGRVRENKIARKE